MAGIISSFPAIEGLREDAEVTASEAGILIMGIVVIKPFGDACETSISWNRAVDIHNATIISSLHVSCVTHLSELVRLICGHYLKGLLAILTSWVIYPLFYSNTKRQLPITKEVF